MIKGYKCFNKGLINRYGKKFVIGETYHADGDIKFGIDGNGFHFCTNLEDTLRFFDTSQDFDVCEVIGFGELVCRHDEYNEYFDMYACENITINKILTREEIINYALELNELRVHRFLMFFNLTPVEKELFLKKFQYSNYVLDAISYYQNQNYDTYKKKLVK